MDFNWEPKIALRFWFVFFPAAALVGCGGASAGSNGSGIGGLPPNVPILSALAPSSSLVGGPSLAILAYGSFENGTQIVWNGKSLPTTCVGTNLAQASCGSAAALTALVPAANFSAAGTANVTLVNPANATSSGGTSVPVSFTIGQPQAGDLYTRSVAGITAPNDIAWDASRGKLYVSLSSADTAHPNSIAVIDPVAGSAATFAPAGNNPNSLSISSDNGYLWTGMDGSYSVQRFLLPGFTPDISFSVPKAGTGDPQTALALQAAPVNAHTVAFIGSNIDWSPTGDGVYVYDDANARPNHVPGPAASGGPMIDWIQWGADDSTIYGNQYTTIDQGGIATLNVNSSGVSLANYGGGLLLQPTKTQFDRGNNLLYSYGAVYDPKQPTLMGEFDLPVTGARACTGDSSSNRYYCVSTSVDLTSDAATTAYDLVVYELSSYKLLSDTFFGWRTGHPQSIVTGKPQRLVRWGKAGLALLTSFSTGVGNDYGNGGIFLIDGPAVNSNVAPDTTVGASNGPQAWLSSLSPASATTASGQVVVTITGTGFSPDSTACWNCNSLQERFLPTTYISPTKLSVTVPLASVMTTLPLEVTVFDPGSNRFSLNGLTFTVFPASSTLQVTPLNLCGFAMAWDQNTQLLYVSTVDYDGTYPNSIVAVNPTTGAVVKSQTVESAPIFLSESANGEFLYTAYATATNFTQLALPGLNITATGPLRDSSGDVWLPGDLKAAPQNPHTVAATLIAPSFAPEALGGIAVFDDSTPRPNSLPGWNGGQSAPAIYDTLAWSASDQLLTSAASAWDTILSLGDPLYLSQVDSSGVTYLSQGTAYFDTAGGYIHSDFGTGLIYSDGGIVADPSSGAIVGDYHASGLVVPDSSLNRVFILGQTYAQANTNNYTIVSFNQKTFSLVSSITLNNLSGIPVALARWGTGGLAVLTSGGLQGVLDNASGMLYIVQDAAFVSSAAAVPNLPSAMTEGVQQRWKSITTRELLMLAHQAMRSH